MERTEIQTADMRVLRPAHLRDPASAAQRRSLRRFLRDGLTLEGVLYGLIAVLAVLTRFWDLGSRALHHDETLHAYYSWLYAEGFGYEHNPLMHGPFLFHANALMYLILGSSDYVSRIMPAVAGVIIVMLPWLLRGPGLLGRWGALAASSLLLVSPSILFYSRFLRHDVYHALGTLALMIAVLRYVDRPEPRWAILGGAAIGYLLCTKEVSFIILFIVVTFLAGVISLRVAPALLGVGAGAVVLFAAVAKALGALGVGSLPGIPWQNPSGPDIARFLGELIRHPLVVAALGVALLAFAAALWVLDQQRDGQPWIEGILGDAPEGSTAAALRTLLTERRGLTIGFILGSVIFVALYSSMFTNMTGLLSGTGGALGYWLGQHDVQRGAQPWFYYLLLLPQYEFVAALALPAGIAWLARRALAAWRAGTAFTRRFYVRGFLIYWTLVLLAILSWAGEKMPWLVVHIALPITLLAASLLGAVVEEIERRMCDRRTGVALGAGVIALLTSGYLLMAWASAGPFVVRNDQFVRTLRPEAAAHWWIVYLPWLAIAVLAGWGVRRVGWRHSLSVVALAGTLALMLFQVHVAWRMTYREGDVPRDMLIYVQTSPDVTRVTHELEQLSRELTGGMGLEVWYDSGTQWPFNWYLRNFPRRVYFGNQLSEEPTAPVVLVSQESFNASMERQLRGYTYQQYVMRWWFPEEQTYRRFAIAPELNDEWRQNYQTSEKPPFSIGDVLGSVWSSLWSLHEPQQQGDLFRLVAFRELPAPVGTYWFRVYVRNDLVPYMNDLRY